MSFSYLNELSAVPVEGMSERLHQAYKTKFFDSFMTLLHIVEEAVAREYVVIKDKLQTLILNPSAYIAPWVYHCYFDLHDSVEQQDITKVEKILAALNEHPVEQYSFNQQKIQLALVEEWESPVLRAEVEVSFGEKDFITQTPPLSQLIPFQNYVAEALALINKADPLLAQEIENLVSSILLVDSQSLVGATSPKFFGAIYVSLMQGDASKHQILILVDNLVHETAHLYLNAIIAHDPLVLNSAKQRFSSPIRADLRPMLGIYHAAFVTSRTIRIYKNLLKYDLYFDPDFIEKGIRKLTQAYEEAYSTITTHGELTPLGKHIIESSRVCAGLRC